MTLTRLMTAAVLLLATIGVDLRGVFATGRLVALPVELFSPPAPVPAVGTVILFDLPPGASRASAVTVAAELLGLLAVPGSMVAIADVHEGLAVVEDFSDTARARDAVQRWARGETWTYRHLELGRAPQGLDTRTRRFDALQEAIVDVARYDRARLVLVTTVTNDTGRGQGYAEAAKVGRGHGVQVHVVGLEPPHAASRDESLLGAQVAPTRQGMGECDPRRVACGDVDQVGKEERLERGAGVTAMWRALSRLASDTGGTLVRAPLKPQALSRLLASAPPPVSRTTPAHVPARTTWRTRESQAWEGLDTPVTAASPSAALHAIRVPAAEGPQLVVLLVPGVAAGAPPWTGFVRVQDDSGETRAARSRSASDVPTEPIMLLVPRARGLVSVDAVVTGRRGRQFHRWSAVATNADDAIGDLFLVDRIESLGDTADASPLAQEGRRYVPLAGAVVRRSGTPQVTAAIATRDAAPSLVVELLHEGARPRQTVVQSRAARGVTHIEPIAVPLQDLADGRYELRLSGEHEGREWTRSVTFTIAP